MVDNSDFVGTDIPFEIPIPEAPYMPVSIDHVHNREIYHALSTTGVSVVLLVKVKIHIPLAIPDLTLLLNYIHYAQPRLYL